MLKHGGNLNKEGGDVAAEGTGAEMRTSGPKSRPTGEWKEQGPQVCSHRTWSFTKVGQCARDGSKTTVERMCGVTN